MTCRCSRHSQAPRSYTVADAVTDWLGYGLSGRSSNTIETGRILANQHVIPALGARKLSELSAEDVDRWLAEKAQTLSTSTLQRIRSILSRALARAQARDKVKRNVVLLCATPTGKVGRPLLMGCERAGWTHLPVSMRFNACSGAGRLRLRLEAGLRRWRLFSARYASERAWVERWLHMIDRGLTKQPAAALAIAGTAAMIQGSGDGYRRGLADWHALIDGIVKPALDGVLPVADLAAAIGEIVALSRDGASRQVAVAIVRIREEATRGA